MVLRQDYYTPCSDLINGKRELYDIENQINGNGYEVNDKNSCNISEEDLLSKEDILSSYIAYVNSLANSLTSVAGLTSIEEIRNLETFLENYFDVTFEVESNHVYSQGQANHKGYTWSDNEEKK